MSALKDLWKDGNSEKRFDPTQLDVTGCSLGGQATWVLWSFYGSCLDPWLHAWELDSSAHDTAKVLRHLPAWTSACKWDFKAFSHEDHWGIAEHRGLNIYGKVAEHRGLNIYGKEVKWSEVTSYIGLKEIQIIPWSPVLRNEKALGVLGRMKSMVGGVHLVPSMEGYERCEGRYPHTKHARLRHRWEKQQKRHSSSKTQRFGTLAVFGENQRVYF